MRRCWSICSRGKSSMPARTTGVYGRRDLISAGILGAVLVLPPLACIQIARWRPRQFYKRYHLLEIGMTEARIAEIFDRAPDQVCGLGSNRIVYYRRGAIGDTRPSPGFLTISNMTEIPSHFGCAQLLFDTHGRLSAYTVVREEVSVTTREGKFRGDNIRQLDVTLFERLRLPVKE